MTTEAELVLMSLTAEELDEASRWVGYVEAHWTAITREERGRSGFATDGPWHLMTAVRLAIIREQAERGGAEPWYAGMPTTGHAAGRVLDLYSRRLQLNAAEQLAPRLSRAGVIEQQCAICGHRKPLTAGFWPRPDGMWSDICLTCGRPDPERLRDAMALGPPPVAVAIPPPPEPQPAAPEAAQPVTTTPNPEAFL
jgi:hypothetical protein